MKLLQLRARWFRNIDTLDIELSPRFNVIYGNNGSGKSSILEMIYCLSRGRSFRTHLSAPMVQYQQQHCDVFASLENDQGKTSIGYRKSAHGKTDICIGNDTRTPKLKALADLLPIQIFEPNDHNFITGGPGLRRKFIDWGLFYTQPSFLDSWQQFQKILKQRNAALAQKQSDQVINAWASEFIRLGESLSESRKHYIDSLLDNAETNIKYLVGNKPLTFEYYKGWSAHQSLAESLEKNLEKDRRYGYTTVGPHRFDLLIKSNAVCVENVFSRGEQKRLICTLYLAQGDLLKQSSNKKCVYLFDDILSELDSEYQIRVLNTLLALDTQVFVTSLSAESVKPLLVNEKTTLFYIENGCLQ